MVTAVKKSLCTKSNISKPHTYEEQKQQQQQRERAPRSAAARVTSRGSTDWRSSPFRAGDEMHRDFRFWKRERERDKLTCFTRATTNCVRTALE